MINRKTETNYYNIGLFVLIGMILIILGILAFGSGKLFERTVNIETYFDESVQGMSLGSPVKYRGMQIGYVKEIAFVSEIYKPLQGEVDVKKDSRYIYVKVTITSPFFTHLSNKDLIAVLKKEVAEGLRFKLTPQGLTGITYLELNFTNPQLSPPLAISWQPKNFYIPSTVSTLARFTENVQEIFSELKDVDFRKLFANTEQLMMSARNFSEHADNFISHINSPLGITVQNLKAITDNLESLSEQMKLNPAQTWFGSPPPPLDLEKL
jgi:ABC-type transporter Mla subunit MlaD